MTAAWSIGDKTFAELGIAVLRESKIPLPETRDRTLVVPGRHGAYDFGAELGPRVFELECVIVANNRDELQQRVRALAAHLVDETGRPRTLELRLSEPDKYYNVRYAGSLSIERVASSGRFTLPLAAYDPYAYGALEQEKFTITENGQSVALENVGNVATPVQFVIKNQGTTPINGFSLTRYRIE